MVSNDIFFNVDNEDVGKIARKLHKQFGHPKAEKLIDLVRKSGQNDSNLIASIRNISSNCEICRKFKKPPLRPVVSMPLASKLNDVVSMDLKTWGSKHFLVMIDLATRFCAAVVINNKNPATIISKFFIHWIVIFGSPKVILTDNGGEFNNNDMRNLGEAFNITIKTTAAESPWSNGVCECQNAVIGDSVRKIMADVSCTLEVALSWAIAARNSLANFSGFSPNQLVFGRNPSLPNVFNDKIPALNADSTSDLIRMNLNAMHLARQEFVKFESNEKIKRALRHNIRVTDSHLINNGDNVYYKRNNEHEWHGPGVVIGRDGKIFLIKHGGALVRVHECRLTSASKGDIPLNESDTEIVDQNSLPSVARRDCVGADQENKCCSCTDHTSFDENSCHHRNPIDAPNLLEDSAERVDSSYCEEQENVPAEINASITNSKQAKAGLRIKGIMRDSGELVSGKLISRAGKATGQYKNCFNLQKDSDGDIQWIDLEKDLLEYEVISDEVEMVVLFNTDSVMEAKRSEMNNWVKNDVYEEVENEGQDTISVRWVTTEKFKNGKAIIKSRLVARGFEENSSELLKHSPTCSKEAVRLTLSIAATNRWTSVQLICKAIL